MKKILQLTLALSVATFLGCGGEDGGDDGTTSGGTGSIAIPTTGFTSPSSYAGMTLAWEDQFEGTTLDIANWTHETGTGSNGWGNNELQYYRSNNTTLQDGHLIITAKEESISGSNYTSSRIISKDKKTFRYGRIDVRAALPRGKGLWPAIWMLGNNFETVGWPACGEIDIMEMVGGGSGDRTVHGTVHWQHSGQHAEFGGNTSLSSGTFNDEFHVFSIEWTASEIRWYLDGTEFHVISTTPAELDEFRRSFFFIMNVAVGGNWPGNPDTSTTFPQHMIVDYVRVFQADQVAWLYHSLQQSVRSLQRLPGKWSLTGLSIDRKTDMAKKSTFTYKVAAIVALGGLLMGFDASVISGVNKFVQIDFGMSDAQLGLSVGSLTFVAAVAMLFSGAISDRFGRRVVLKACAIIFTISAVGSALAPNFILFLLFRMLGGIGVGASLILAPMYIAEIAPPTIRGTMVSFNQLNIVVGISLAFFTNYLILSLGDSDATWVESLGIGEHNWRWMLGLEALPAVLYFLGLYLVPRSPRWLLMKGQHDEALRVMKLFRRPEDAEADAKAVQKALAADKGKEKAPVTAIFKPAMRLVLVIGLVVGILQQITGINSVFFYAPMIFEQTGGGTDAAFQQAIIVGLVNLVFTVLAMVFIDRLGRKKLLSFGVAGIAVFMFLIAYGFNQASYKLKPENLAALSSEIEVAKLQGIVGSPFENDVVYKQALRETLGDEQAKIYESELITAAIEMNPTLILIGILGFIASFAISLGPVMWVLFSELFPLSIKAIAISFVGFINSMVSAGVQSVFPWELSALGSSLTFLIYGIFAVLGLVFILMKVPETKGKSLEELEAILIKE